MSRNDIVKMSVQERVALMEEIWASFEQDNLEYPTPSWHEKVLKDREEKEESHFIAFDEAKKHLSEALHAYKNS